MIYHRHIGVAFALSILLSCMGQTGTDSVQVHFRQSKTRLEPTYMGNGEAFDRIGVIAGQSSDLDFVLVDVKVVGGASPEGSVRFNDWLSRQRAARIFDYMDSRMLLPDSVTTRRYLGRDWHGLRDRVAADRNVPFKADVLVVIDEIIAKCDSGAKDSDASLLRLKRLHGGVPYLYLYRNIFPSLREASVVLTFEKLRHRFAAYHSAVPELSSEELTPAFDIMICAEPEAEKNFYMALKSNLIADALSLPEIGAEFYLGRNWSIVGNWMYGWWDKDRIHKYWRAYGGDIAARWWFGSAAAAKPLTGHHIGLYGGVVTYDFEFGGKGHMGGRPGHNLWDRCMKYGGFEYGYSLPIARRWNIDFTLGLGYMGGKYVEYVPWKKFYAWQATKQKRWVGPTKLEVSLVWLIGHGNYNKKGAGK